MVISTPSMEALNLKKLKQKSSLAAQTAKKIVLHAYQIYSWQNVTACNLTEATCSKQLAQFQLATQYYEWNSVNYE